MPGPPLAAKQGDEALVAGRWQGQAEKARRRPSQSCRVYGRLRSMRAILWGCLLAGVLCVAACSDARDVAGTYELNRQLMVKSVAAALGYGPGATADLKKVPKERAKAALEIIASTGTTLFLNQDGTFSSTTVVTYQGQVRRQSMSGTWKLGNDQVELTMAGEDGGPATTTVAEIEGDQLVMWEPVSLANEGLVKAVYDRVPQ